MQALTPLLSMYRPSDQATPKASAVQNPFDTMANPAAARSGSPALGSAAKLPHSPAVSRKNSAVNVPGTPTGKTFSLPFFSGSSDRVASMSASASSNSQNGDSTMSGSASSGMVTPGPSSLVSSATTSLSTAEPDFSFTAQPPRSKLQERVVQQDRQPTTSAPSSFSNGSNTPTSAAGSSSANRQPRGKLSVKMIQARNLACTSASSRPYVVATYDQNEFVGREPIAEADAPVTSYATRRNSNAGNNGTIAPPSAAPSNIGNGVPITGSLTPFGKTPPNASMSSSGAQSALAKSLEAHRISEAKHEAGGSPRRTTSAYDPVWKQEVILCVFDCCWVAVHSLTT